MAWRFALISLTALIATVLCYFLVAWTLVFFPAHRDFSNDGPIQVFVRSNGVHTDLVLPVMAQASHADLDWKKRFPPRLFQNQSISALAGQSASMIAIGWGDQEFYLNTPQWEDLKLSTALSALSARNPSLLHVEYLSVSELRYFQKLRALHLDHAQYRALVQFIDRSIDRAGDAESAQAIPGARYGNNDAFFKATGHYSALQTCNVWIGDALRSARVQMSLWTPFAGNVMGSLPKTPKLSPN